MIHNDIYINDKINKSGMYQVSTVGMFCIKTIK